MLLAGKGATLKKFGYVFFGRSCDFLRNFLGVKGVNQG